MIYSVFAMDSTPGHMKVYDPHSDGFRIKQTLIAFHGACQVVASADSFFGGEDSKPFKSKVLINPTWRRLYGVAKQQQKKTLNMHHDFFEGYYERGEDIIIDGKPVRIIELALGS
jgi:hypothetical protein